MFYAQEPNLLIHSISYLRLFLFYLRRLLSVNLMFIYLGVCLLWFLDGQRYSVPFIGGFNVPGFSVFRTYMKGMFCGSHY